LEKFVKGDIVVVNFPFSDLTVTKKRPAYVAASLPDSQYILCQITSKNYNKSAIQIELSDFLTGSLNLVSYLRPEKIFTADSALILYKTGSLVQSKIDTITDEITKLF